MSQGKVCKFGEIIVTEAWAKELGVNIETARELIKDKLSQRKLRPVFRLKTTQLPLNPWTPELTALNKKFDLPDGSTLDGTGLENIEIAFFVCVEFQV